MNIALYLSLLVFLSGVIDIKGCVKRPDPGNKVVRPLRLSFTKQVEEMRQKVEDNFIKSSFKASKGFIKSIMALSGKLTSKFKSDVQMVMELVYSRVIADKMTFTDAHKQLKDLISNYGNSKKDQFDNNADVMVKVLNEGNRFSFNLMYTSLTQNGGARVFNREILSSAKEEVVKFVNDAVEKVAKSWIPLQQSLAQFMHLAYVVSGKHTFKTLTVEEIKAEFVAQAVEAFMNPMKNAFCGTNKIFKSFSLLRISKRSEAGMPAMTTSFEKFQRKLSNVIRKELQSKKRSMDDGDKMLEKYLMQSKQKA